jgi:hypothetical protein
MRPIDKRLDNLAIKLCKLMYGGRLCKSTDQYKMAKADGHFKLDDGRNWNNLTEDVKLGF